MNNLLFKYTIRFVILVGVQIIVLNNVLFIGTYPGLNEDMIKSEIEVIKNFAEFSKSRK